MSVGSLARHGFPGPLSGGRRAVGAGAFAAPALVAVAAIAAVAAALRFDGIGHQGFWFDEANTAQLVQLSPGKMLGLIPQSESTPPLYYCVAWVWARVFGHGEAGLRSLSAVAGVLVVPVAYAVGARLMSRGAGLIVAALTACNPLLIWYSQEARSYSMLVLLGALSLLAFVHARASPTPGAIALWVLASGLALATHYFAALTVVPEAAWLLVEHRGRRAVSVGVAVAAACGLVLIPLAISQNGTGHDSWIASAPLGLRLRQIVPQFLVGTGAPARQVLRDAAIALVIIALARLAVDGRSAPRGPALAAGGLAAAGLALSLILALIGFDDLITRNVIILWLPAACLVAGGLGAAVRARWAPRSASRRPWRCAPSASSPRSGWRRTATCSALTGAPSPGSSAPPTPGRTPAATRGEPSSSSTTARCFRSRCTSQDCACCPPPEPASTSSTSSRCARPRSRRAGGARPATSARHRCSADTTSADCMPCGPGACSSSRSCAWCLAGR